MSMNEVPSEAAIRLAVALCDWLPAPETKIDEIDYDALCEVVAKAKEVASTLDAAGFVSLDYSDLDGNTVLRAWVGYGWREKARRAGWDEETISIYAAAPEDARISEVHIKRVERARSIKTAILSVACIGETYANVAERATELWPTVNPDEVPVIVTEADARYWWPVWWPRPEEGLNRAA